MDAKGFFLGVIAAIVLFLLWKKEQGQNLLGIHIPAAPGDGAAPGCASCGASPLLQGALSPAQGPGTDGQISPGTPPLNSSSGVGSFYADSGPTPNTGFGFRLAPFPPTVVISRGPIVANRPGSPTTPSNIVPVRATAPVAGYAATGFQQRFNIVGIQRTAGARALLQ